MICYLGIFILFDYLLNIFSIEGRYYINHFIGNMIIVYNTLYCVSNSYKLVCINECASLLDKNDNNCDYDSIDLSRNIIYALHFYHVIWYFNKLRKDDWIHHIIMVLVALPLSHLSDKYNVIGHSFFFLTGLPGGLDYLLLFLVRNNIIDKMIEKKINRGLNLWIRCPGCIATVVLIFINSNKLSYIESIGSYILIIAVYWNGIYFMEQTVSNYAIEIYKKETNLI